MKFALFTTNLAGGGAEKALAKIAAGLAARGHEVDFFVCEDAGAYPPPPGCRFSALSARAGHGWLGKRRLAWKLKRTLAANPPDLLVSTLPFADEVAALARLPRHACRIANTLSAEIARLPAAKATRREARYRNLYAGRPLVAVSRGVADDLVANFCIDAKRIRTIANPFDVAPIRALAAEPCPARPTEPYLLHVGRFAAQKRHDLLLEAFARLDGRQRLVLLTPPDLALAALIARRGLERRVNVADFQANPYPWMAGAELLVLCSDHEGLPNVLIVMFALISLFVFLTTRTTFGRRVYAMGGNEKAAKLSGINTERLTFLIFVIMGALTLLNPTYLLPMFTTDSGQVMRVGCGLWMLTGILVMRQMINFEI